MQRLHAGVSPMSDCIKTGADAGSAHRPMRHERLPLVSPTRALHQDGSREYRIKILSIPTRIAISVEIS
ncbi:hypothetical protein [Moorena sp. SIO3H5]|uniref:hypothetical protein n=1 Tax=Moorena sp. SIO3H5 TaxID=2607834 RepID=UPI0013BD5A55|nr:hypothetical protein [Moorena sp. SIO3H5]NEO69015.1 hypothetical protein [Moorena sp. SIO3H5]